MPAPVSYSSNALRAVYIYALTEPDAPGAIRYIGKVTRGPRENAQTCISRRRSQHMHEARNWTGRCPRRIAWLKRVIKQDSKPGVILLDTGNPDTSSALETWHILSHRTAGYNLVNATDGGEGMLGYVYSPAQRQAMSLRRTGKKQSPEQYAKTIKTLQAVWHAKATNPLCSRGHSLAPESGNLFVSRTGKRACRLCRKNRQRERTAEHNEAIGHVSLGARKTWTHCPRGHEYNEENAYRNPKTGRRQCKICRREACHRSYLRGKGIPVNTPNKGPASLRTHCPKGHEYTADNTIITTNGGRRCRECTRQGARERRSRR